MDPAFKTVVESVDCCQLPKIGKRFNGYQIDSFEGFHSRESDATSKFGVSINFSRTNTNKFLLQYHLVCCPLVVAASISFLMEPITFPGRIGIIQTYLVTIILTITSFFASGQVFKNITLVIIFENIITYITYLPIHYRMKVVILLLCLNTLLPA